MILSAAILSRGPSAFLTWPAADRASYTWRLGINCACDVWVVDWIVAADPWTIPLLAYPPRVGTVWRKDLLQPCATPPTFQPGQVVDACTLPKPPHAMTFSLETAVQFAAEFLHVGRVDIFGADYGVPVPGAVAPVAPGRQGYINENVDRWNLERRCMRKTLAHYAAQGVKIRHVYPDGMESPL
jgi:hypothetical protein